MRRLKSETEWNRTEQNGTLRNGTEHVRTERNRTEQNEIAYNITKETQHSKGPSIKHFINEILS